MTLGGSNLGTAYVRVIGMRRGGTFVEFEYSLNDADLTVELVMPLKEFDTFCAENAVTLLEPAREAETVVETFQRRERTVGRQA
ncbi:MAG: hypothetical protein KDE22_12260 [Rhodobacterales bacterium]|nr:hypothetical protein [Rhodobacterales bacterium]